MDLYQMVDVLINCVGYSIEQANSSDIDILGMYAATGDYEYARAYTLKNLAIVLSNLTCLTHEGSHWPISRRELSKYLAQEV